MTLVDDFETLVLQPGSTGQPLAPTIAEAALGSAVLIELYGRGRIALDDKRITVVDPAPTGDRALDDGLRRLQQIKAMRPLHTVRRIGRLTLKQVRANPIDDQARRQELVAAIRPVVEATATPPEDVKPLLVLLYVTNAYDHPLGKEARAQGRRRGKEILDGPWADPSLQYLLRETYTSMTFTGLFRSAPRWLLSATLRSAFRATT